MKKRIFIGIAAVAVAAIVTANVNLSMTNTQGSLSALTLANMDAIVAYGESSSRTTCSASKGAYDLYYGTTRWDCSCSSMSIVKYEKC
jgi:hypothetical protein